MRKLIYVPVVHTEADMGSLAKKLYQTKLSGSAEKRRRQHAQTVIDYWDSIETFFNGLSIPGNGLKIYQDGMFADGNMALAILKEGVKSGSRNSIIVQKLIDRGATLIKTEDYKLVKAEYDQIQLIVKAPNRFWQYFHLMKYKMLKPSMLKKRDCFIAATIDETLQTDQLGILFIGAYHNIAKRLPADIEISALKDLHQVKKYMQAFRLNRSSAACNKLSQYLASPCSLPSWPKSG